MNKTKNNIDNDDKITEELQERILDTLNVYSSIYIQESKKFSELLAPYGISYPVYQVLIYLLKNPHGVEPSKIADELSILRQTMTTIIDMLQKKGFVKRIPHPTDRRKIYIELLPDGRDLAISMRKDMNYIHSEVMKHFTKQEMELYLSLRNRITMYLDKEIEKTLKKNSGL